MGGISAELAGLQVECATKKITGAAGGRRRTLGDLATRALWDLAEKGELERTEEEWATLQWFYGLPHDPEDLDLRSRYRDADKIALNLLTSLERAHGYAQKNGGAGIRRGASADAHTEEAEPAGWQEWFAAAYPKATAEDSFWELPEDIRAEFLREKEKGGEA